MTFTAAMIGGAMGTGAHMFTNAARKLPLSRQPWGHVGLFIVGAYFGNLYERTERELVEELNEIRAKRNMPPLVGTGVWFPKPFASKYE